MREQDHPLHKAMHALMEAEAELAKALHRLPAESESRRRATLVRRTICDGWQQLLGNIQADQEEDADGLHD